jgi:hypothetical protein
MEVFRIQIRRIRMFLGFPDPHPDSLATNTDPDADLAPDLPFPHKSVERTEIRVSK